MNDKHFSWEDWEAGAPIDERHLEACPECRRTVEGLRFLKFQTDSAPRLEAPPFFAARVSRLATSQVGSPFWIFLETAARRLIPVFAALLLATTFLLYRSVGSTATDEDFLQVLVEPHEIEVSLDDAVVLLRGSEGEGDTN